MAYVAKGPVPQARINQPGSCGLEIVRAGSMGKCSHRRKGRLIMAAKTIPFTIVAPSQLIAANLDRPHRGAINVEVPALLAQQIADAAIWEGKTPQQFVVGFLQAAFPERSGAT